LTAGEGAEPDRAYRDPCEPFYIQMKVSRHPADFPVFPLAKDEIVMSGASGGPDRTGFEDIAGVRNARSGQLADSFGGEFRGKADPVSLFHFIPRVGEFRHEITVVGKQDQTFAVLVEPSGGDQPGMFRLRDEVDGFPGGMAVFERADITARLVQHDVEFFRGRGDRLAPVFHAVAGHDPHGAAFRSFAVDCDLSGEDQRLSPATGTYARSAQKFSQAE